MRIRRVAMASSPERLRAPMGPMTAMLDIVFQLLIFFLLTLKLIQPEGHFDIHMPVGVAAPDQLPKDRPISVRLAANADGSLQGVFFGQKALGGDSPGCFERLNQEVARLIGPGRESSDELEVEIDAAYNLDYQYTIKAVSACLGRIDPGTRQRVPFVSRVNFKPAQRPAG